MGRWWQVDPEAEQFYGMSPYTGMGNNPVNAADPNGDIPIYIIPNISFNKGGINIGIEFGIGVPGVSSLSVTGGISLGRGGGVQPYWSVQAGLGGGYAGYGSGGSFGGLGPFGWTQGGGWSVNVPIINIRAGGASGGFGLSYGENGWDWSASGRYTHQGELTFKKPISEPEDSDGDLDYLEPIEPLMNDMSTMTADCCESGIDRQMHRLNLDYLSGKITKEEYIERHRYIGEGGKLALEFIPYGKLLKPFVRLKNIIPKGKLANHLFKGVNKLADTPVNRALITKISNGKPLVVDKFGKHWYRGVDASGRGVYTYTRGGVVKGAGYTNLSEAQIIKKYSAK